MGFFTPQQLQAEMEGVKSEMMGLTQSMNNCRATGNLTFYNELNNRYLALNGKYEALQAQLNAALSQYNIQPQYNTAMAAPMPTVPVQTAFSNSMFQTNPTMMVNQPELTNNSMDSSVRTRRNRGRIDLSEPETVNTTLNITSSNMSYTPPVTRHDTIVSKQIVPNSKLTTTSEDLIRNETKFKVLLGNVNKPEGIKEILSKYTAKDGSLDKSDFIYLLKDIKEFSEDIYNNLNAILVNRFNILSKNVYKSGITISDMLEDYRELSILGNSKPEYKDEIKVMSNNLLPNFMKNLEISAEGNKVYCFIKTIVFKAGPKLSKELDILFSNNVKYDLINNNDSLFSKIVEEYTLSGDVNYTYVNPLSYQVYVEFHTFNFNVKKAAVYIGSRKDNPESIAITTNI